jgi:hypothetical protein
MSLILDKCVIHHDIRNECVASEKKKVYKLINDSNFKIRKIKVDKCLPQNEGEKRCDYLMSIEEKDTKRVFFIELKGERLIDAVKQIYSTIIYLKDEFKNFRLDARIVGSGDVPGFINNPHYIKLKKEIHPTKGEIRRATNKFYSEII